ncbi:uncharacterized protein LOC110709355 [Chenopodium quinoa]|uniref:uncharacterized protein LOC110709355 n=1 Tax=Chenopodium quinoa TaxID=63459 RepID=UPI000B7738ED|nr:uncharacterized protein LOC110709355 [Chenopodium quinoa]
MAVSDKKFNEMMTHNKMLETQINQLSNTLKDYASPSSLPSQGVEPKKPIYSITTKNGRVLNEGVSRSIEEDEERSDPREEVEKGSSPFYYLHRCNYPMPRYSKFLKEILSGKRKCNEVDSVEFGNFCSAFIHNELPKKMEDLGNFSIPCEIKGKMFDNAFCELGSGVSVMPYSTFKKLKLGELLPSDITLQLADRTIMIPKGRVEDVPLKIGGFTIPVDFIVLEIAEDDHIPIILERPFLATSGALIDVKGGRITLRFGKKEESFELKPMHESLSLVQGIMCANCLRSIDNVCMINSSTNDVLEICDDALSSLWTRRKLKFLIGLSSILKMKAMFP